jgi:hypothetical protein
MLNIFSYMCSLFACLLWKNVNSFPFPIFFNLASCLAFLLLSCMSYSYNLYINLLFYIQFANIFPYYHLPFHFIDYFLCCAETFWFDGILLIYFCVCFLCFWSNIHKVIINEFCPYLKIWGFLIKISAQSKYVHEYQVKTDNLAKLSPHCIRTWRNFKEIKDESIFILKFKQNMKKKT